METNLIAEDKIIRIIATSEVCGLILHQAILFESENKFYIVHQTFAGPEITTLDRFTLKRKILDLKEYKLKKKIVINDLLDNPDYRTFNLINRNCENFCNDIINTYTTQRHPHASQQVIFWSIVLIFILYAKIKKR